LILGLIIIYNIVIKAYSFLVWIASFFNPKAKKFISGRKNWKQNLKQALENNKKPVIWFHCASLGEFEQARPVIEGLEGDNFILLSFFSPSGYEVRKNYAKANYVCYLPLDTASNASFFVKTINPKLAVFVKYEFWYYFLSALQNKKIPHILISAVFRENQYIFDTKSSFLLDKIKSYTRIFVQDENSFQILQKVGFSNAELAGDTRFDRVLQTKNSTINLPQIQEFKNNEPLFVCGSIWNEDFEVLLPFLNSSSVKTIIAPHEIHQEEINKWKNALKRKVSLYSDNNPDCEILIIDNVGLLSSIYAYANFAYVGGAFGKGLHNILEPAVFGIPVVFGPKIRKFPEAIALINNGGCFSIQDENECKALLENLVNNENKQIGAPNAEFIEKHKGASTKILTHIQKLLN
jgi:3-deoxy-D-manno-octulosonic-acid transferase